jgi:hypothetical protein
MKRLHSYAVAAVTLFTLGMTMETPVAEARGAGSSIMNSPGYQRRLQESRGYVTNESGSLFSPPAATAPPPYVRQKPRQRRR